MRAIDFLEIHDIRLGRIVIEPERVEICVRSATVFYVDHDWDADANVFASCTLVCDGVRHIEVGEWSADGDSVYDGRVVLRDGTVLSNRLDPSRFGTGPAPVQALWLGLAARDAEVEVECATLEIRDIVVSPPIARRAPAQ